MHLNLELVFGPKVTQNEFPLPLTGDITLTSSVDCQVDLAGTEVRLQAGIPNTSPVKDLMALKCKASPLAVVSVQFTDAIQRLDPPKPAEAVKTAET